MSMNLHCREIELWQTPTHITYMCLTFRNGLNADASGDDAKAVLLRYVHWARSQGNGVWEDEEALKDFQERIALHVEEVEALVRAESNHIYVYFM